MSGQLIVIDGPAGAGKSTVARRIAEQLGAALLDTGAIYRSLAWLARERGVDWGDEPALAAIARQLRLEFRPPPPSSAEEARQQVLILSPLEPGDSPVDVTTRIRTPDISEGASRVSSHPAVRAALLEIQRAIAASAVAAGRGCVAEGRDMGTVVFPDAPHKFFLTASQSARAQRRLEELLAKGESTTRAQVEAEMARRDQRDSSRAAAPLQQAEDAVRIDSSGLDVEAVVATVLTAVAAAEPGQAAPKLESRELDPRDGSP